MSTPAVLVVVESYWGNTDAVARAVVDGLRSAGADAEIVGAAVAPVVIGAGAGLVLIGAPTHNMALPSPSSRRIAAQRGVPADRTGVREWIQSVRFEGTPLVLTFDTHVARFSGSAARDAAKRLRRIQARVGERFVIAGEPPVLVEGELERARAWGARLVGEVQPS